MRRGRDYLDGLIRLGKLREADEQRAVWRQSMATLGIQVADRRPVPLEGLDPNDLLASVRVALSSGLVDDVGFLAPPTAAVAMYELAAALPAGEEKRQLGRRVLRQLHRGDAPTFVALATQLALSSPRALGGASTRARVALSLDLPIAAGARADALALALISRRETARGWLTEPSTGSLASRRLAARLLERAAREAARRASQGDDSGVRVFEAPSVGEPWRRLLRDRESLVWRHVATARGLLSGVGRAYASEIERDLAPDLTPTEWRRAAASLAARIAVAPTSALREARALLDGPIPIEDRGTAGAMMLGLPRAAEAEPEAVDELLTELVSIGGLDALEALVDLRREHIGAAIGEQACDLARAKLQVGLDSDASSDDGRLALMEALRAELSTSAGESPAATLPERIGEALLTFAREGALEAYTQAQALVDAADGALGTLLLSRDEDSSGRRHAFRALRELDLALVEQSTMSDLLTLGAPADGGAGAAASLADLFGRLSRWLVTRERTPIAGAGEVPHFTHRMCRMRTLLHLVDADPIPGAEGERERRISAARMLLERVRLDADSPMRRIVCATASRACDALVREELCEVSDVLIAALDHCRSARELTIFAEASMVPEVEASVGACASLADALSTLPGGGEAQRRCLDGLLCVVRDLPSGSSPRVEALRAALLALVRALEGVCMAACLGELVGGSEGTLLTPIEGAARTLAQLVTGARRRLGGDANGGAAGDGQAAAVGSSIRMLDFCVEHAMRGERDALDAAVESASEALGRALPRVLADSVIEPLARVSQLPVDAPRRDRTSFVPHAPVEAPLPAWLPPGRVLGGFYVLRPLGAGGVGSVFVARRAEERHDPKADRFALKVPEYDGAAARMLSEAEFLDLFRREAGALLTMPRHHNLANFVTFDAGARPKPILVMELVEGPSLERTIELGDMDMGRALDILEGITQGLEQMHRIGVGHLDVKPSNVILRGGDGGLLPRPREEPVLVDFGLAGRRVRPGCATGEYGAPEIWGSLGKDADPSPLPADVYSLGCLAYELLTGRTLFTAPNEMGLIAAHVGHDGSPPAIEGLLRDPSAAPVGQLLRHMLRGHPSRRAAVGEVRQRLVELRPALSEQPWPLLTH